MKKNGRCFICLACICFFLLSCGPREGLAPVEESHWDQKQRFSKQHVVKKGETLFAIAFQHDQDYHALAAINHLVPPYALRIGQVIKLNPSKSVPYQAPPILPVLPTFNFNQQWMWPAKGRIKTSFSSQKGQKGIEIAGVKHQAIYAAASGTVAYAGNGLSGYGNLIILKHDKQYLTAYANNSRNLVREGQMVKKGQKIAEMGVVNRRFWGVHFEIRKAGQPVNPLNYLH